MLKEHERRLHDGDVSLALFRQTLDCIKSDLMELKQMIKALQDKPAKRWDAIVNSVVSWAVVAFLAYIAFGK